MTPRWLEGDEILAWRGMLRITSNLLAALDADLAPFGLTLAEYEVLSQLVLAEDHSLRMTELAARSLISRSGLTRRVDGLERRGLVRREMCADDRRGANAVLTADGEALHLRAAPTHAEGVRRYFTDRLTRDQLAAVSAAFAAVGPVDTFAAIAAAAAPAPASEHRTT